MMTAVQPLPSHSTRAGDPAPGHPGRHEPEDAALIAAIVARDAAALDQLYVRFRPAAFAAAYAVLRDPAAAEDIVHDAFLSVWRNAGSYRPERGALRAWLLTIVRNAAIDYLRSRRVVVQPAVEIDRYGRHDRIEDDVATTAAAAADARRLRAALRTLPDSQRDAVEMAFFAGLTHGEIADRTGLPLGTVKGRLRLGLRRLRKELPDLAPGAFTPSLAGAAPSSAWQ